MPNSRIIPIQVLKGSKVVPMTPDEYARYQQSVLVSNAQTWLLTLIAAFLFLTTFVVESKAAKSLCIFTALAVSIGARLASGENVKDDRIAKDYSDGSDSSRQSRIFQQTAIEQVPVESWYEAVEQEEETTIDYPHDLLCKPHSRDFIERFTLNRNSKLIVGAPGCGKTVTAKAWIATLLHYFPQALLLINYRKRASFCGLEAIPGLCQQSRQGDLTGLFDQMRLFHKIHQSRSDMSPDERANQRPAVFYIADYAATWGNISAIIGDRGNKQQTAARLFLERLNEIITVGRENNVQIVIDTQSFNLTALGNLDSNERGCLTTLGLGFESVDQWGQKSGNYEVLQLLTRNAFMISAESDREQLLTWLPLMRDYSQQSRQPLAFTTLGGCELFFLPDYRFFEHYSLSEQSLQTLAKTLEDAYNSQGENLPESTIFLGSDDVQDWLNPAEPTLNVQPGSETAEPLNLAPRKEVQPGSEKVQLFTTRRLPANEARTLILLLRSEGWTKPDIICNLWNCTKGGSKDYKQGKAEYESLIGSDD